MVNTWSTPVSPEIAARRAGGRRRYNAERQCAAKLRRFEVVQLLKCGGFTYAAMAAKLDVGISTIARDVKAILNTETWICPCCNALHRASGFLAMRRPKQGRNLKA
jgi:hypothetical protein